MTAEWIKHVYYAVFSKPLKWVCVTCHITPNQVTVFNHFLTLTFSCYFFSRGTQLGYLMGVGSMMVNVILDFVDGDLAKSTGQVSAVGVWLDSVFDVAIQALVCGAILIGCSKQGLPVVWIIFYYVSNVGSNLVSFYYNSVFGFDSHAGNKLFRYYMEQKPNIVNRFFKNLIDPTSSGVGLATYTVRYWIVLGAVLNAMPIMFMVITVIQNLRWFAMYVLYAIHLLEYKKLWISQALAILDKERQEYYAIRYKEKVQVDV
jgi:phosphatidylglycerophosphate synthase